MLNESIILKHRVRPNEQFVFDWPMNVATKVIIPFERSDLEIGGRSFFVGQRGWMALVQDLVGEDRRIQNDLTVFQALDELPALDPFLLREHLSRRGFNIAKLYFSISSADLDRMQMFVASQIMTVIEMAFPKGVETRTEKLAALLLSTQIDERLEPLRMVLRLDEDAYREGMFSWKGFLYYQWAMADIDPRLAAMLKDLPNLQGSGRRDGQMAGYVREAKTRIIKAVRERRREVSEALEVYHSAYRDLTQNGKPMAFRDFLLKAPDLFMVLGDKVGAISHLASFWKYRFSNSPERVAPMEEVLEILQDFEAALAHQTVHE
ncbi:MAG: hypothetical protein CGW95_10200 [Phenylobacterium zucineum]|nr:MAG: hypothetical protein CGW95_10200 [Phenylobacterium zucineum]